MKNLNFILEQINGAAALLTFCLLVFLSFYLWDWRVYKRPARLRTLLTGLPPALALASIIYLETLGTLITRATVWGWRLSTRGTVPFTYLETSFLLLGAFMTSAGILLMIRLLTSPRFGGWPWKIAALISGGYVTTSVVLYLW
jgi:hypothetical protein